MIFEEVMKSLEQLSPGEVQAAMEENTKLCMCPSCPTYAGTENQKYYSVVWRKVIS